MEEKCDNSCPLVTEVQRLTEDNKRIVEDIKQLKSESKQNEYAISAISRDLAVHMSSSEARDRETLEAVRTLATTLNNHMKDEEAVVHNLGSKIDNLSTTMFDPEKGLFFKLKDEVTDNKFKTRLMWGVMGSLGASVLTIIVYFVRTNLGG